MSDPIKIQETYTERLQALADDYSIRLGHRATACVVTFGCQMNARDSEKLSGILAETGFLLTEDEGADLVIYNTCTVRDNANQRVYGRLGALNSMKKEHPLKKIILCGCMVQDRNASEHIRAHYGFVDLLFGTHRLGKFPELLCRMFEEEGMILDISEDEEAGLCDQLPVKRKYPYKSGLNIMYGCNNFCSYCIVPYVRGRERSREPEDILGEARKLASEGVREIMLLGQNVNSYGQTLAKPVSFASLLEQITKIDGIERIRFMTSHPKDLGDDLISVIRDHHKICRHLHLPLQSGSTRILQKMNRRYTKEQYLELAGKIRAEIPDMAITTDIIVGFPDEREEDVEDTLDVIRKVRYENAFTFIYSPRKGTPAAEMVQVPSDEVHRNFDRVLSLVQETAREATARYEGSIMPAMTEEVNPHDGSLLTGRLSNNTIVHYPGSADLIGQILPVRLTECRGFYYLGERV